MYPYDNFSGMSPINPQPQYKQDLCQQCDGQLEVKTFTVSPYKPQETTNEKNAIDLSGCVKTSELEQIRAKLTPKKVWFFIV